MLAQKYKISPQQITNWKKEFLDESESIFDKKSKSNTAKFREKEDGLHKIIGQQKVEIDFLKRALS